MYKHSKQANNESVIEAKPWGKLSKQYLRTKKGTKPQEKSKPKEDRPELKEDVYTVNAKIHLNNDVPEEVQQFIKLISRDPQPFKENCYDVNLLGVKERKPKKLPQHSSPPDSPLARKDSVQVIVTTDFEPNNLSNTDYDRLKQGTRFTEYEIVQLWHSFKQDFPKGRINKTQLRQLIKTVFPRSVPDLVLENIFRIFDPHLSGSIRFTDLLIAFSMSMKGSVEEKLHWAFKLYDKDGNGSIDQEEMEEIFSKLCLLVNCEKENEMLAKEKEGLNSTKLLMATRLKLQEEEGSKMKFMSKKLQTRKKFKDLKTRRKSKVRKSKSDDLLLGSDRDDDLFSTFGSECSSEWSRSARSGRCSLDSGVSLECPSLSLAWEMRDPERDCSNFDPVERARELFEALDVDGDGVVTEEEFITGCMRDDVFIMLLQKFSGEDVWGIK